MNDTAHLIYTHSTEIYEARLARHLREAEVQLLLGRPDFRIRLASSLRSLADRLDHSTPAFHTRLAAPHV